MRVLVKVDSYSVAGGISPLPPRAVEEKPLRSVATGRFITPRPSIELCEVRPGSGIVQEIGGRRAV